MSTSSPHDDLLTPPVDGSDQQPPTEAPAPPPVDEATAYDAHVRAYEAHIKFLQDTPDDDTETEFMSVDDMRRLNPGPSSPPADGSTNA
jgi:hypothetical protein